MTQLKRDVALLQDDEYVAKLARSRFFYSKKMKRSTLSCRMLLIQKQKQAVMRQMLVIQRQVIRNKQGHTYSSQ